MTTTKRTDAQRVRWVKQQYGSDRLNITLDGVRKPTTGDRRVEGEHVLHAWRQRVDLLMDS